jgi:AmmeMemoRadiSam system protein B
MIRRPAASGRFYPGSEFALKKQLDRCTSAKERKKAIAVVAPHAGYDFSGRTAGAVFSEVEVPGTAIVLGPSHWGGGARLAIMSEGSWDTPLGEVPIDSEVAAALKKTCDELEEDAAAHEAEHSLEVEIPFLQHVNPEVTIVPIAISTHDEMMLESLGRGIAETIRSAGKDILIVASSDMSHTERSNAARQEEVRRRDMMAIEAIVQLDARKLLRVVREQRITMCGPAPVAAAITAAKLLGAREGRLVSYTTSYDTTGDYSYVVGYAGIVIE